ncbi:PAP/fibrillin family protein [Calothrix rhizosoleniae]|uniref:PAP/fibrillin family protein n=1 Tax=Calothrix rhizosoleniae TaxID=888997 RepID=UPI000B49E2BE|nr:PAP/fibrillin family protein [Calothrix rhizosoleniae]
MTTAKTDLLQAIAGTNRGILATEAKKQAISVAIANVENINPTPSPLTATHLLNGNWRLIYTTSKALLNLDRLPGSKVGQIYQYIDVNTNSIYNLAEIVGLPYAEGLVSVAAKFEPIGDKRVNVKFERSIIGLQRLIGYKSPDDFIQQIEAGKKFLAIDFPINSNQQQGWLDITYIDTDLRIGRGNEGSIFVLTKT